MRFRSSLGLWARGTPHPSGRSTSTIAYGACFIPPTAPCASPTSRRVCCPAMQARSPPFCSRLHDKPGCRFALAFRLASLHRLGRTRFRLSPFIKACRMETAQDASKALLLHQFGGFVRTKPALVALSHLGPALALPDDLKRKHADLARDHGAVGEPLLVCVDSHRGLPDASLKAGLFVGFPLGRAVRLETAHGPAFRNHPAAALARGDQHDTEPPLVVEPKGQGADLLARLSPGFSGFRIAWRRR